MRILLVVLVALSACAYRGHQTRNLVVVLGSGTAGGLAGYGVADLACPDCTRNQHMAGAALGIGVAFLIDTLYMIHDMHVTWEAERHDGANVLDAEHARPAPPIATPDPLLPLYDALARANTACGAGDQPACARADQLQRDIDARTAPR